MLKSIPNLDKLSRSDLLHILDYQYTDEELIELYTRLEDSATKGCYVCRHILCVIGGE